MKRCQCGEENSNENVYCIECGLSIPSEASITITLELDTKQKERIIELTAELTQKLKDFQIKIDAIVDVDDTYVELDKWMAKIECLILENDEIITEIENIKTKKYSSKGELYEVEDLMNHRTEKLLNEMERLLLELNSQYDVLEVREEGGFRVKIEESGHKPILYYFGIVGVIVIVIFIIFSQVSDDNIRYNLTGFWIIGIFVLLLPINFYYIPYLYSVTIAAIEKLDYMKREEMLFEFIKLLVICTPLLLYFASMEKYQLLGGWVGWVAGAVYGIIAVVTFLPGIMILILMIKPWFTDNSKVKSRKS